MLACCSAAWYACKTTCAVCLPTKLGVDDVQDVGKLRLKLAAAVSETAVLRHEMFRWKQKSAVVKLKQTAAEETTKMLYGSNKVLVAQLHQRIQAARMLDSELADVQEKLSSAHAALAATQVR